MELCVGVSYMSDFKLLNRERGKTDTKRWPTSSHLQNLHLDVLRMEFHIKIIVKEKELFIWLHSKVQFHTPQSHIGRKLFFKHVALIKILEVVFYINILLSEIDLIYLNFYWRTFS